MCLPPSCRAWWAACSICVPQTHEMPPSLRRCLRWGVQGREGGREGGRGKVCSFLAGVGTCCPAPLRFHLCPALPSPASSQVLVLLARLQRGAQLLCAGEGLVPACKELLVGMMVRGGGSLHGVPQREYHGGGFNGAVSKSAMKLHRFRTLTSPPPAPPPPPQGNWPVFGMVVKLIKNVAKHDSAALLPGGGGGGGGGGIDGVGEVVKLLLGVARLVSRMPDQRKLLKVRQGEVGWGAGQRGRDRGMGQMGGTYGGYRIGREGCWLGGSPPCRTPRRCAPSLAF